MDTFTRVEGKAAEWLWRDYRRAEREAIQRAYSRFARCYRRWANSLFDLPFLLGVPAEILAGSDARPLAEAYVAQLAAGPLYYRTRISRQRQVQVVLPVAVAFLQLLARERLAPRERG
jgi:hypothetical protein